VCGCERERERHIKRATVCGCVREGERNRDRECRRTEGEGRKEEVVRWQGCQPYAPADFTSKKISRVLISVRG
jgi:hypothetical protein